MKISQNKSKFNFLIYLIAALLLQISNSFAGGYSTSLYSASGLGNAYAGSATGSHDISDLFFNPSISAGKKNNELIASFSYLRLAIDPDNIRASNISGPKTGTEVRNAGTQKLIPAIYFSSPINEKLALNIAVTSPFGLETKYNNNWAGRYRANKSSISTLNFNPSIAYKINSDLSIGAGLIAQYFDSNLTKEAIINQQGNTAQAKVEMANWGYGYNFGLKYDVAKDFRVGFGYRSKIKHKGKVKVSFDETLLSNFLPAKTFTPESYTAGIAYDLNSKLQLVADTTLTRWSRLKSLDIVNYQNSILSSSTKFNWNNSYLYSVGANFQHNPRNLYRAGLAYESEAINSRNREARVPGSSKYWLTFGLNHKFDSGFELDLSYVHQIYRNAKINIIDNNQLNLEGDLSGKYKTSVDAVSFAIKKNF